MFLSKAIVGGIKRLQRLGISPICVLIKRIKNLLRA